MRALGISAEKILRSTWISAAVVVVAASLFCCGFIVLAVVCVNLLRPDPYPYGGDSPTEVHILEDGWKGVANHDVKLLLPPSFGVSDPQEFYAVARESARDVDKRFRGAMMWSELAGFTPVVVAVDENPGEFVTNVIVGREQVIAALDLEGYMHLGERNHPAEIETLERGYVRLGHHRAGRRLITWSIGAANIAQLIYSIKVDSTIWSLTFSTSAEEYEQRRSTFEQAARSFRPHTFDGQD